MYDYCTVCGEFKNQIMRNILFVLVLIILGGCTNKNVTRYDNSIDLDKSESILIPTMSQLGIWKLELTSTDLLVINDTLILMDKDTSSDPQIWVADTLEVNEWTAIHGYADSVLIDLKNDIVATNNYRIIRDNESFFFSEGGFIDSNYGKAFIKGSNPTKDIDKYQFDRIKSFKKVDNYNNWYVYFAD
jgi:hypothetical protein